MKYFLIVVLLVLAVFAYMRLSKSTKSSTEEMFEKYPYPSMSKLIDVGIRPAIEANKSKSMVEMSIPEAQEDVRSFMSAYDTAISGKKLGDVMVLGVAGETPGIVSVEATDTSGQKLFEGTLRLENPDDHLYFRIVEASVQ